MILNIQTKSSSEFLRKDLQNLALACQTPYSSLKIQDGLRLAGHLHSCTQVAPGAELNILNFVMDPPQRKELRLPKHLYGGLEITEPQDTEKIFKQGF